MNGLQSLMQGAPRPPQPAQPAQAMPAQNNPQMNAAMDVVDNDLDKLNLDPRTKALLKTQEAFDLVQSAQRELAMSQPQQMPPTIEGQRNMQTMEGIAGMMQSLAPGMQQRGRQVQASQARQMLSGGMPSMGAPNMQRMSNGGIAGYQEGGFLGSIKEADTKLNQALDQTQTERLARGRSLSDYNPTKPYEAATNLMYDTGVAGLLQKLTGYKSQVKQPERKEQDPMAEQLKQFIKLQDLYEARKAAGAGEEELRRIESALRSYDVVNAPGYNIQAEANKARGTGMARGGIIGYSQGGRAGQQRQAAAAYAARQAEEDEQAKLQAIRNRKYADLISQGVPPEQAKALASEGADVPYAMLNPEAQGGDMGNIAQAAYRMRNPAPTYTEFMPEGSSAIGLVGDDAVGTTETPVATPAAPAAPTNPIEDDILAAAQKLMGADSAAARQAAGARLQELAGLEDLMGERKTAQDALQAQRETRFSPEKALRRRASAGLAGLAERGLGGYAAGRGAEMDRIDAERIASSEASVADMDKLISDLRQLGLTQFEAENKAAEMVETNRRTGMTTAQSIVDSRQRAADAKANRVTQERGQDITERVGMAQVKKPSDFMNEIQIRVDAIQAGNPQLSDVEARSKALAERIEAQAQAQLAAAGVRAESLELDRLKAAYSMAADRLANRFDLNADPAAYNSAFDAEVKKITDQFSSGSGGSGGGGVPTVTSQAQFDALPSGATYMENGVQYRKP